MNCCIYYADKNLFELNFDSDDNNMQLRFFVTRDEMEKMIDNMNSKLEDYPKE